MRLCDVVTSFYVRSEIQSHKWKLVQPPVAKLRVVSFTLKSYYYENVILKEEKSWRLEICMQARSYPCPRLVKKGGGARSLAWIAPTKIENQA
jgi:hypothetical protein